ncbi:SusE domain-containing protein [Hymenobacter cavernae]|uniref:SusE outer membrane protein domain-containing protein n=1 Tax=Hymenobacter cavernae TaxID=2044852 RepID=A0ABQ1UCH3_9BACT|nr:SusE domain-containing protein [Hymenobacter cavernae]GGF13282.1 hypothetical protein GCM10011383_25620 [Hymenobacter cavernae]
MKTQLTQAVAGLFAVIALALASCEKDEVKATLKPDSTPTLTASTNTVVLKPGTSKNTAVAFNWTPISSFSWGDVEHPYNPTVTYSLELAKQGTNFASPVAVDAGVGPATNVTVGVLNTALNNLGVTPETATPIEVRLKALYAANTAVYSPTVPLTATSFVCRPPSADVWTIIGPAAVDWDTDVQLTYDCDLQAYTITRAFKADNFKFRLNKGWTVNYGSNAGRDATGSAPLTLDGGNISIPSAGTYTVILDLNKKTYTLTQ